MKRILWFSTILAAVLIVLYMEPVFFPPDSESSVKENKQQTTEKVASLSYDKITTAGLASYVNKPVDDLQKDLGKPVSTQATGFDYVTNIYEDEVRNLFIEANIKDNTVQSIKVAGKSTDKVAPFHFGMSLTDLTEITTLFPNFSFNYNNTTVDIELSEEDMNYRPLIAFDNDTFAILFFGRENNELYAVDYLNKATLLQLMPYQLNSGDIASYELADLSSEEWKKINSENSVKAKNLIGYLRGNEDYPAFRQSGTLRTDAEALLKKINQAPEGLLQEESAHDWQNIFSGSPIANSLLVTTDDLKDANDYKDKKITALASKPVLDVSFTLLQWYSDPYVHGHFVSEDDQALEIAFSKENMVVLIQEQSQNTEESSQ